MSSKLEGIKLTNRRTSSPRWSISTMLTVRRIALIVVCTCAATLFLARLPGPQFAKVITKGRGPTTKKQDGKLRGEGFNRTLGFEKIFVINLPERTDRRDAMTLATSLTDLDVEWIEGWPGRDVSDKAIPADSLDKTITNEHKGSWRAHMDTLREIIAQSYSTALILEDDSDWDVRIKSQMEVFARATSGFLQPLKSDPTRTLANLTDKYEKAMVSIYDLPEILRPQTSPFGDGWDVLWLGHCGTEIPTKPAKETDQAHDRPPWNPETALRQLPMLQVTIPGDETVPKPEHLKAHPFAMQDKLATLVPPHTRIVHASSKTTCTQAYAVSQKGAQRLLWQFGLQSLTSGWDLMLRDWCEGSYIETPGARRGKDGQREHGANEKVGRENKGKNENSPVCLTVQPPLFSHHFGKGAASDIIAPGGGFVNKGREMTPYVRLSVRMNMGRLARGDGWEDLVDQWPDER